MKPYMSEDATSKLQEIFNSQNSEYSHLGDITPGEAKRIDLIRRMKEDTDKSEYMIMLNGLFIILSLTALIHYYVFGIIYFLIGAFLGLVTFLFIRYKLKAFNQSLVLYKNDFDTYLWEGYHLKEMRYTAVKLSYMIFFPIIIIMISDLISGEYNTLSIWVSVIIAIIISSLGWVIYFFNDQQTLDIIESDLKSLHFL